MPATILTKTESVYIEDTDIYFDNGSWWVSIMYSDSDVEDIYGPYTTKQEAERVIY